MGTIRKLTPAEQYQKLAALQAVWRTEALKDARYNQNRQQQEANAGNMILARGYRQEGNWDVRAAGIRHTILHRYQAAAEKRS